MLRLPLFEQTEGELAVLKVKAIPVSVKIGKFPVSFDSFGDLFVLLQNSTHIWKFSNKLVWMLVLTEFCITACCFIGNNLVSYVQS